jgi:hypothetical protein
MLNSEPTELSPQNVNLTALILYPVAGPAARSQAH